MWFVENPLKIYIKINIPIEIFEIFILIFTRKIILCNKKNHIMFFDDLVIIFLLATITNNCKKYTFPFSDQTWYFYCTLKLLRYSNLLFIYFPPRVLEPGGTLKKQAKRLLFYIQPPHFICRGCLKEPNFEWNPLCRHLYPICNLFVTRVIGTIQEGIAVQEYPIFGYSHKALRKREITATSSLEAI